MKQIYKKTLRFQFMKLLPGLFSLLLALVLYVPVKLWCDYGLEGFGRGVVVLLWALISGFIYYLSVHYYGYVYQTAFLAAAAEYAVNQALPASYRDFVQQFVKSQFKKPADFTYLYRLIGGAVKELHKGEYWKDKIMLDYMTYCCTCINFYKKKAGKYKTMADAVVLFSRNQKELLGKSQSTGLIVAGSFLAVTLLLWSLLAAIPVLGVFSSLVLALIVTGILKYTFLDSWFLTRELLTCGQLDQMGAEQSYVELSGISRSFRKLYHKVRREQSSLDIRPVEFDFHSLKFCGECGALVAPEAEKEEDNEVIEQENPKTAEGGDEEADEILQKADQENEEDQGMEQFDQNCDGKSTDSEAGGGAVQKVSSDREEGCENSGEAEQTGFENDQQADQKVVFCGECGSAIFPEEAFCGECGAPAERKEKKLKFCVECGAPITEEEKFCGECGTKIESFSTELIEQ